MLNGNKWAITLVIMKQPQLSVIWEEDITPDAAERLAAAFDMLFGDEQPDDAAENQGLDKRTDISNQYN